jgi:hypothetical protein
LPEDCRFKGRKRFVVQDLRLEAHVTRYHRECYRAPDGTLATAPLPAGIVGHFGANLVRFVLQQYYECNVTEPKLLAQLHAFGIKISLAALSNLLIEGKAAFHAEKQEILAAGLSCATALTVDDTGARHQGRNGHTTHIGNQYFAFFETTESKSRVNFLRTLLLGGVFGYRVTDATVAYWQDHGLPQALIDPLLEAPAKAFADDQNWQGHLTALGITGAHHQQCATEGALWGAIVEQRLLEGVVVVSDGAPQFAIGDHARCWIHAERQVQQVACATPEQHRLAWISHTTECIGAANQRKPLCRNELSMICGAPRCRQSVARTFLDLNLLKAARWWRRSTLARSPRMPGRCFWVRQIAPSG